MLGELGSKLYGVCDDLSPIMLHLRVFGIGPVPSLQPSPHYEERPLAHIFRNKLRLPTETDDIKKFRLFLLLACFIGPHPVSSDRVRTDRLPAWKRPQLGIPCDIPAHDGVGKIRRITVSYVPSYRVIGVRQL